MRIGIYIILLIALIVASITDLKKHEIPTWVFPGSLYLCIFYIAILNEKYFQMDNLIGYLCAAIPVLIACLLDKMGGADLIMFSTIGLILGTQDMLPYVLCLMICRLSYSIAKFNGVGKSQSEDPPRGHAVLESNALLRIAVRVPEDG